MKLHLTLATLAIGLTAPAQTSTWEKEVIYQIFPRSFYSSRNNHIGDLKGITQKLDYLHQLGITSILINPIFDSRVYHNYFADDFLRVDPTLGTNADFFQLIEQAHKRQMKVILDMEVQYVADHHPWLIAAEKGPKSPFASYLWRKGSAFYDLDIHWYDNQKVRIAAINPDNTEVRKAIKNVFRYWTAPDGNLRHGVDGFRIDHMMDDLDSKHVKTGMLQNFWQPIEADVRSLNPKIFFLAEQADWGLGADLLQKADVDAVYAIPLYFTFLNLDKKNIEKVMRASDSVMPPGKTQLIFIENHDVKRFASAVKSDPNLLRLGAVFNLTVKGTPLIYYGQELGMHGVQGTWDTDGNDIPIRLAYRWTNKLTSRGTADFYRNTGPWDKTGASKDDDGISVTEESPDPNSLLNFYKRLIHLRQSEPALQSGSQNLIDTKMLQVLGFQRAIESDHIQVFLNLSGQAQIVSAPNEKCMDLLTHRPISSKELHLEPHGFKIIKTLR